MKPILMAALAGALSVAPATIVAQEQALGQWHGVVVTPAGDLTLLVTIRQDAAGGLAGEMESPDQAPGRKIPLAEVAATARRLAFSVPGIAATFEGTWNDATQAWNGVLRQGVTLPLVLARGAPAATARVEGLDGKWRATLQRGETRLRLVLRVRTEVRGTRVTLDSPDLNAYGLAVARFARAGDTVRFAVPAGAATFVGTLDPEARTLRGRWSREGQAEAAVTFEREMGSAGAPRRTQWPIVPSGYREEEVTFPNPRAPGVTLAGTLTIPDGAGPFPAAVLISGSGAQDRDQALFGHRPFAVLADHLARRGVAVLRYDDRGFGASTGDHGAATSADFATDAGAAVRYLLGRREIDAAKVGFIGHSEGALIGPLAAADDRGVAFLVLLAGPGTGTLDLLLAQRRLLSPTDGETQERLARTEPLMRRVLETARDGGDPAVAAARVRDLLTPEALEALGIPAAQREATVQRFTTPWMRYFLGHDPAAVLARLEVPVLALHGTLDRQVPPAENLAAMEAVLARNPDATVVALPGLNHFFQTAGTGAPAEYAGIAETFAPAALDLVSDWIVARFGGTAPAGAGPSRNR